MVGTFLSGSGYFDAMREGEAAELFLLTARTMVAARRPMVATTKTARAALSFGAGAAASAALVWGSSDDMIVICEERKE